MELHFENGVQASVNKGEEKKLAQENEVLKAQIQKMKRNPERSRADKRLINGLNKKALEYQENLEKSEAGLARIQAKWIKKAEKQARFYEGTITILRRRISTLKNEAVKQAQDFKANRECCYDLVARIEEEMLQLQNQHLQDSRVLEARNQQIGRLLQEKGVIRERIRNISDYILKGVDNKPAVVAEKGSSSIVAVKLEKAKVVVPGVASEPVVLVKGARTEHVIIKPVTQLPVINSKELRIIKNDPTPVKKAVTKEEAEEFFEENESA
ncbi:uncharacterized protein [Nicotiana sylvestris]|uniref:uncharacterized protein n=1 Tax=Nicotiana sylvestris TaxID=4096 RepID=UPI00388CAD49